MHAIMPSEWRANSSGGIHKAGSQSARCESILEQADEHQFPEINPLSTRHRKFDKGMVVARILQDVDIAGRHEDDIRVVGV